MGKINLNSSLIKIAVRLFFALMAAAVISSLQLDYIESFTYDIRVRAKAAMGMANKSEPDVVLVYITMLITGPVKAVPVDLLS